MIRLDMKNYNTSEKIDKYESLTAELLPSYQSRIIEQPKFTYFSLEKTFEKNIKTIGDQRRKQVEALEVLKPENNQQDLKKISAIFLKEFRTNDIEIDEYIIMK